MLTIVAVLSHFKLTGTCPAHVLNHLQARYIAGKIDGHVEVGGRHRPILDFSENIMFSSIEESLEWKKSHVGYIIVNVMKLDEFHNRYVLTRRAYKNQDGIWKVHGSALLPFKEY